MSTKLVGVVTRAETAATTRRSLVLAASELLDSGGPDAVTLRAVGALAGVSRGAPYGHFKNKEHLLAQLAIDAWNGLADRLQRLHADKDLSPTTRLERALLALVDVGREHPHLYALMFSAPSGNTVGATEAASRSQEEFLNIVAEIVGRDQSRRYGALLMSSAYGISGMELSGHLSTEKWNVTGNQLVAMLASSIHHDTGD
ncbi:TetR family transcriptional regulator [Subtercola boreus]|uniref:TetR family transcriptional regulator n=2 Tax=Subtercola boreus TaxID=120213 RepID=A0A3E0W4D2_9MICO|nr:TetR family transcriptional regulator [Subtercola boreus]